MKGLDNIVMPAAEVEIARPQLPARRQRVWCFRPMLLAGRNNRVEGSGAGAWLLRLTTLLYGASSDNVVQVGRNFRTKGIAISMIGRGNRVEIGDDVHFSGEIGVRGTGLTVRIGERCDIKRGRITACKADVTIGRDCLIGVGVRIRTSDIHRIVDRASRRLVNPPRKVVVGDGVWLAAEAALLKGARVPDGCVVGFRSAVTHAFDEPDCVLAGSPARIVRRGISWSR